MCFSANASFIAGISLTVAGTLSLRQVKNPAHLFFAAIPLLFGIQQFCEGFLWMSFSDPAFYSWHTPAKYAFLVFAQVIWPTWIPLAFLQLERFPARKKVMRGFLLGGIAVSLMLFYRMLFYPLTARVEGCHITYAAPATELIPAIIAILYLGAIVVTPFFSSWKKALLLASVNVLSLSVTLIFFEIYFVSVWCFFAAVQSVIIILIMREVRTSG